MNNNFSKNNIIKNYYPILIIIMIGSLFVFYTSFNLTASTNIEFGVINSLLAFIISYKCYKNYVETADKRLMLVSAGFLTDGILKIFYYLQLNSFNKLLYFEEIGALLYTIPVISAAFISINPKTQHPERYKFKILSIFFLLFF